MIVTKKMLDNEYTGTGIMEEEDHKIVGQWEKGVANGFQILRANGEFHSAREWKMVKKMDWKLYVIEKTPVHMIYELKNISMVNRQHLAHTN